MAMPSGYNVNYISNPPPPPNSYPPQVFTNPTYPTQYPIMPPTNGQGFPYGQTYPTITQPVTVIPGQSQQPTSKIMKMLTIVVIIFVIAGTMCSIAYGIYIAVYTTSTIINSEKLFGNASGSS